MEKVKLFVWSVVAVFLTTVFLAALISVPIKLAWNEFFPAVFGFKAIDWKQAMCLTLFFSLLLNSYNSEDK